MLLQQCGRQIQKNLCKFIGQRLCVCVEKQDTLSQARWKVKADTQHSFISHACCIKPCTYTHSHACTHLKNLLESRRGIRENEIEMTVRRAQKDRVLSLRRSFKSELMAELSEPEESRG